MPKDDAKPNARKLGRRDYLLSELRAAVLRAKLTGNHLEQIGIALKFGIVDDEMAIVMLREEGLLDWFSPQFKAAWEGSKS
jgi:hypothetical protein